MRMNISVPDDLAEQARARKLPISAICQDALRLAIGAEPGPGAHLSEVIATAVRGAVREVLRHELTPMPTSAEERCMTRS